VSTVLVIDNYDSFTYNLVQYLGELGASVVVHRNDAIDLAAVGRLGADGIVISPGPCTPETAGISVELIRSFAGSVPMLGVCLGHRDLDGPAEPVRRRPLPLTRHRGLIRSGRAHRHCLD